MKNKIVVLILTAFFSADLAAQHVVSLVSGYMTVVEYLEMNDESQRAYAMGFMNGVFVSPILFSKETAVKPKHLSEIEKCAAKMSDMQIVTILRKYFDDRPELWDKGLNVISLNAMFSACRLRR